MLGIVGASYVRATDSGIKVSAAIPLFLKIITYDANFKPDSIESIRIHVVYDPSLPESMKQMQQSRDYFKGNSGLKVSGLEVEYHLIKTSQIDNTFESQDTKCYDLLIVTHIGDDGIGRLVKKVRGKGIHTFAFDPEHVPFGLTVGIRDHQTKNPILVNLDQAKAENSQFTAHLLKMCEIYEPTD